LNPKTSGICQKYLQNGMYLSTTTTNRLETEGSRKGRINPKINQVELGFLLGILGKTTQPVHDSQEDHQFYREYGTISSKLCFHSTTKIGSRPTNSSQTNAERVLFQGSYT